MTTKKAFDLSRDSVYVADPIDDLRIIGGKGILPPDEAGPHDTEPSSDMSVPDLRRLKKVLSPEFRANVAHFGVKTPITIAKIDDMAVVLVGKRRVRALRAANRERKKRGEPLLKIRCVMQRDTSIGAVMSVVVLENSAREDDELLDRIEKAQTMIDAGMSEDDVALAFTVKVGTLRGWLMFSDRATDATKQAVKEGRLPASSAAELAQIAEPEKQNEALQTLLTAPTPRGKSSRAAKMLRKGTEGKASASDRKSQQRLLEHVQAIKHPTNASDKRIAFHEGIEETLKLILGAKDADERLVKLLADARAPKTEAA